MDEWIKQLWDSSAMEDYSAIRKKKILPFATAWMDPESITLSDVRWAEKDKHHVLSLLCGIY